MDGFAITDFSVNSLFASYGIFLKLFDVTHGLLAGTDAWDSSATQWTDDMMKLYKNDPAIATAMSEASHRILYTVANSHAMNGFTEETAIVNVTPWWETVLVALIVVLSLAQIGSVIMLVRNVRRKKVIREKGRVPSEPDGVMSW